MTKEQIMLTLLIALGICCFGVCFSFIWWLRKYRIITTIFHRMRGAADEYNKNRKAQLKLKLEQQKDREIKFSLLDKIFLTIKQIGVLDVLPGFSELHIFILYIVILLFIGFVMFLNVGAFVALAAVGGGIVLTKILCTFIIYEKRERIEAQLSTFVNACEGAASIHADIIDIFGEVYDKVRSPLSTFLEECYVEAKTTNDKDTAILHLKEKTDSLQFRSVIDNLTLCSHITGDYRKVIDDIRGPIRIYNSYKNKRRAIVRNGRITILVMAIAGLAILFASTKFINGFTDVLLGSQVGVILLMVMGVILVAGLTIRMKD